MGDGVMLFTNSERNLQQKRSHKNQFGGKKMKMKMFFVFFILKKRKRISEGGGVGGI
jgi:hypothetical protein